MSENYENFVRQPIPPSHFQKLVDLAQHYGYDFSALCRLVSNDAQCLTLKQAELFMILHDRNPDSFEGLDDDEQLEILLKDLEFLSQSYGLKH
ncbi:hypothetical protein [Vibrio neonatus]|uniref:hypothetical protein n=1 Tax=Vibrio neonatus TaxID=278860 RepID=UPI0021C3A06D|nr:hypothetical protein [Vibrio neonatus]